MNKTDTWIEAAKAAEVAWEAAETASRTASTAAEMSAEATIAASDAARVVEAAWAAVLAEDGGQR